MQIRNALAANVSLSAYWNRCELNTSTQNKVATWIWLNVDIYKVDAVIPGFNAIQTVLKEIMKAYDAYPRSTYYFGSSIEVTRMSEQSKAC